MARLLGSGSKGRTNNPKLRGGGTLPPGVDMLDPAESGAPDTVLQRSAAAMKGVMLSRQLRKNKSTGLKP